MDVHTTLKDIDNAADSNDVKPVYFDLIQLYQLDSPKGLFRKDLISVNEELAKKEILPAFSIESVSAISALSKESTDNQRQTLTKNPIGLEDTGTAEAAKLIESLSPQVLTQVTDNAGMITLEKLKSANQTEAVKTLESDFPSVSSNGQTINPDAVLRTNGIELSSTAISKYNLVHYLSQDKQLLQTIETADGTGLDLQTIDRCVDQIAQKINPLTGYFDTTFWTPERTDIIKQLEDSKNSLSLDGLTISGGSLANGAANEIRFRSELVQDLSRNHDVRTQITNQTGKIDEQKLEDFITSNNNGAAADPLLLNLASEFIGISGDQPTIDLIDMEATFKNRSDSAKI